MNEEKRGAIRDLAFISRVFLVIALAFWGLWAVNERWFDVAIGSVLYFLFVYSPFVFALVLLGLSLRSRKKGKEEEPK